MSRGQVEITTKRDPADTLTAVAVIMAYVCQSADGDLDSLGIRWRSVNRPDFTTASRECARRLCPFFPDKCLVHGARRRAAHADVVVTNHSLLFRNVAAEGRILPRFVTGWSTRPIPSSARRVANGRAWFRQMSRACCLSAWVGRVPARSVRFPVIWQLPRAPRSTWDSPPKRRRRLPARAWRLPMCSMVCASSAVAPVGATITRICGLAPSCASRMTGTIFAVGLRCH